VARDATLAQENGHEKTFEPVSTECTLPSSHKKPEQYDPTLALAADSAGSVNDMTSAHLPGRPDETANTIPLGSLPPIPGTNIKMHIPGYEILDVLGRGGMGVVYKARQLGLNRLVAIKMILSSQHANTEERMRFQTEAEAVAKLHHPNIVQIYDVGENEGNPYIALEFVDGGTLGARLVDHPMTARQAAELMEPIARAVHFAHTQGILHRDLKPANILMAPDGTPKLTDFGLAKRLGEESSHQTGTGSILGTPSYMAPEQAEGKVRGMTSAVDTYALGSILYHALTGRPPFFGETVLDTLQQVKNDDPVPPRRLQPKVPRDLETICLKCLQKEPHKRYPSAEAFANDLRAFLDDRTIHARPVSTGERVAKWAKRSPMVASLLALLAVVIVGGFLGMFALWRVAVGQREQADQSRALALEKSKTASELKDVAERNLEQSKRTLYAAQMNLAQDAHHEAKATRLRELLEKQDKNLVGFEFFFLKKLVDSDLLPLKGHTKQIRAVAFRPPDGKQFATGSEDGTVVLWHPDAPAARRHVSLGMHKGPVRNLRFAAEGNLLASGGEDGTLRIWDLDSMKLLQDFQGHTRGINSVAFSPDGTKLVSASEDNTLAIWDVASAKLIRAITGHEYAVTDVAFTSDGSRIASASMDRSVRVWDVETGKPSYAPREHNHWVTALTFGPDDRYLASASYDKELKVWDAWSGELLFALEGLEQPVRFLAFNPSGKLLAASCADQSIVVWDLNQKKVFKRLPGEPDKVRTVAFSRSGDLLATVSFNLNKPDYESMPAPAPLLGVRFGASNQLAAAGADGAAYVFDLERKDSPVALTGRQGALRGLCFLPESGGWCAAGEDGSLSIWSKEMSLRSVINLHPRWIRGLAADKKGLYLATAGDDHLVKLLRTDEPDKARTLSGHAAAVRAVAFRPDGKVLASVGDDQTIILWSVPEGKRLASWQTGSTAPIHALAFSDDGRLIAGGGADRAIRLWQAEDGTLEASLRGHTHQVNDVIFCSGGRRIASASEDGTVKIWDVSTGQEMLTLRGHRLGVTGIALSPDGHRLASVGWDQHVILWDAK
jgi:WD40 repeat protein/tRNA A-37 threonylcarbamoyl transferase component Bud32